MGFMMISSGKRMMDERWVSIRAESSEWFERGGVADGVSAVCEREWSKTRVEVEEMKHSEGISSVENRASPERPYVRRTDH